LPNSVVDACTVNAFKARLDKFWQHQLVKFDFSRSDGYQKPIRRSHSFYDSFFSARVVNIWNSLSNSVVDACTVNAFKARLDKF